MAAPPLRQGRSCADGGLPPDCVYRVCPPDGLIPAVGAPARPPPTLDQVRCSQ